MAYQYAPRSRPTRGGSDSPAPPYVPSNMAPPGYKSYASYGSQSRVPQQQQQQQQQMQRPAAPPPTRYYYYPEYPAGPLGFFVPPPGQPTLDQQLRWPPSKQALYTTYPTRLRTGVTSLVQPENVTGGSREREAYLAELDREVIAGHVSGASTPRVDSPAPGRSGRTTTTTMSGRRAGRVNYAEQEESEESSEEEIEEAASDPEDDTYGERRVRRRDKDAEQVATKIKIRRKQAEQEPGWTWLGDRVPAERVRSDVAKLTKHKFVPEEALAQESTRPELLVPITLDYDVPSPRGDGQGIKIRDRFMWNANEPFLKPIDFATVMCNDIGIDVSHAQTLADLIQTQLDEAQSTIVIDLATDDSTPDDVVFSDEEVEEAVDEGVEPDCRIIINLDVQIFMHVLRDRIEWDLSSPLPPSEFARHYCAEMGLTGEAVPLITHAIHEELMKHKRDALELDLFARTHPHEQAKWDKGGPGNQPRTTNRLGARGLVGVWRDWWERDEFSPLLVELTADDMDKRETERSREARRMMRNVNTTKRRRYY